MSKLLWRLRACFWAPGAGAGALAAITVLPGNCGPASGLLAYGAEALAATTSLPGNRGPASGLLAHGAGALAAILRGSNLVDGATQKKRDSTHYNGLTTKKCIGLR